MPNPRSPFTKRVSLALTEEQLVALEMRAAHAGTTVAALIRDRALAANQLFSLRVRAVHAGGGVRGRDGVVHANPMPPPSAVEVGFAELAASRASDGKNIRCHKVQFTAEQLRGLKAAARRQRVTLSDLLRAAAGLERVGTWGGAGRGGGRPRRARQESAQNG